jgi:hypothetical protein
MRLVDSMHARFDFTPATWAASAASAPASIHFTRHIGPKIVPSFCD